MKKQNKKRVYFMACTLIIVSLKLFAVKPIEKGGMKNLGTSLSPA